jgi:predicted dehydrogenase
LILNTYADGASSQNTQAVAEQAVPLEILRPNYSNPGKLTESTFFINGNYQSIKEFVKAILTDAEPPVGYQDGLMALKTALAIEKSVAVGRAVKLSEIE